MTPSTAALPGVVLVGGGPGDPGLMTVAGQEAIREANVILVDHLAPSDALAWAPDDAEVIDVAKLPRGETTSQKQINELLVEHGLAGRRVVRLKGGDGFVFGRGMEELQACAKAGVPARVIPGVTSATAVPALAGIPVTHRGLAQGFAVISGHVPPGHPDSTLDYGALAAAGTTIVMLMGVLTLPDVTAALLDAGLDPATPAAVVASGASPDQQVVTGALSTIADAARAAAVAAPAVTVIGDVAAWAVATPQKGEV
jgi:uroporphyrin-III C-methyltransferase